MDPLRPYLYAAFLVGGLALLGGIYAKGRLDASHAAETRKLEATIKSLRADVERWRVAYELDAQQALADQKDADLDADAAKELIDDLEDPDAVIRSVRDADRLRAFVKGEHKARPAAATK